MKKKIGIITSSILILIVGITLAISKESFAALEPSGTISLSCDQSTINSGSQTKCSLSGTMTNSEITAISARLNLSSNLQLVSITKDSSWEGNGDNGIIELYKDGTNGTSFKIVTFTIKANSVASDETATININNIKYKDSDYKTVNVNDFNKQITIAKIKNSNNYLRSLSLSNVSLSFNRDTTTYNINVASSVSLVNITASVEDSTAKFVSGYGPRSINLNTGSNTALIKVQAENGNIRTYTLNINRANKNSSNQSSQTSSSSNKNSTNNKASNTQSNSKSTGQNTTKGDGKSTDNKLKSLTLSKGNINFKSEVTEYNVEVPYTVKSLEITAVPSSTKATIKGAGTKTISVGKNKFELIVTAENGNKLTYTINITRKEDTNEKLDKNNDLASLSIENHKIDFDKDNVNYEVEIKNEKTLNITAIADSQKAEVSIIGNENLKDKDEIKIVVTAEDGSNKTYTITVNQKKDNMLLIISIVVFIVGLSAIIGVLKYKKNQVDIY